MPNTMKRVLIVTKYRFIGDTLTAIPTIKGVKERWPQSEVSLLSGARACELLQNCPYVDKFFEFDPYRASDKGLGNYVKLLSRLRKEDFDLALVLNRSFHSALTAALGGASRRAGWSGFECRDFLLTDLCTYDKQKPEIDCFLDVVKSVAGQLVPSSALQLWLSTGEVAEASTFLPDPGFLIGVQPGATHGYKQWPIEHFVALCEQLVERQRNASIVLIGGPEERPIAEAFLSEASSQLRMRACNLVGRLSLRLTLAAVSQLNAFIGNDTAIRHAAVALNVPSIGLFGPTSCSKWGNENLPRHIVISSKTERIEDVSVEQVLDCTDGWNIFSPAMTANGPAPLDRIRL